MVREDIRLAAELVALHYAVQGCEPSDKRLGTLAIRMLPLIVRASGLPRLGFDILWETADEPFRMRTLWLEANNKYASFRWEAEPLPEDAWQGNPSGPEDVAKVLAKLNAEPAARFRRSEPPLWFERLQIALDLRKSPGKPVDRLEKRPNGTYPTIWDCPWLGHTLRLAAVSVELQDWMEADDWVKTLAEEFLADGAEPSGYFDWFRKTPHAYKHTRAEHHRAELGIMYKPPWPPDASGPEKNRLLLQHTNVDRAALDPAGVVTQAAVREVLRDSRDWQGKEAPGQIPLWVVRERGSLTIDEAIHRYLGVDAKGPKLGVPTIAAILGGPAHAPK